MMVFAKNGKNGNGNSLSKKNKNSELASAQGRIYFLSFFILVIFLGLVFKLCSLQIFSHDVFKLLAEDQHTISQKLIPRRGEIFLQDNEKSYPLAVNKETKLAYVVPKEVENPEKTAMEVSQILNLDVQEVLEKIKKLDDGYEPLKNRLSEEEIKKIIELNAKGIRLADENYRFYPFGELAANVLGFVGWQGDKLSGRYGIESYFQEKLQGEEGNIFQNRDTAGRWIPLGIRKLNPAKNGSNLILTIDHIIQYETERLLKGAVKKFEADSGSIVVMDPETGKILSMANYPSFDPNNYSQVEDINSFRNLSTSVSYECGSIFKPITMAMGVDSGKISSETTYTDTGSVKEAGYTIKNSENKVYGLQTMSGVLENSINTGVIFVEKQVGNKNFLDYVKRFGFGETTGIELEGESYGDINNLENLKSDINFFTASFGQGIMVTPIQLASAFSAIANGGKLMKPQIVEKIISENGTKEEVIEPKEVRRVISESAAEEVKKMLRNVVEKGHGKRAGVPGYLVGGKTGTAQVASTSSRGYEEEKTNGSFAGFAPLENPKYTIMVRIENPRAVEWAESSAAPTFGELMRFLLEYANVEPTEAYTQKDLETFNVTHDLKKYLMEVEKKEEEEKKKVDSTSSP